MTTDGSILGGGASSSPDLGAPGVFQSDFAGTMDMFVAKIDLRVPTASFVAAPDSGVAPLEVAFDAGSSGTPVETAITDFAWDFGEGATAQGPTVEHTFAGAGRFLVTLTVTNSVGLNAVVQRSIEVGCPPGPLGDWSETGIGDPGFPGSARLDGDHLSLCAGGSRLSGASDRFHFVHRKVDCDAFTFTVRVQNASTARRAQVGLMVREGLEAGARHACVVLEPATQDWQARFVSRNRTPSGPTTNPAARVPLVPPAAWLRIERQGDVLRAAVSADGTTWAENAFAPVTISGLARAVYLGFAGMGDEPSNEGTPFIPLQATLAAADIKESCAAGTLFRRGDCNDDGAVDISDAVCNLTWLFLAGETPACVAVTNANGDLVADISDAVYLLTHLFLGGAAPIPPYPDCGHGSLPLDRDTCEAPPGSCQH